MAQLTAQVLLGFAPHLSGEEAVMLAEQAILEGAQLAPVLDDAAPGSEGLRANPRWGFKIVRVSDGAEGVVVAPKQLTPESSLAEVAHCVNTIALATSIVARATLRAWGYRLDFFQTASDPAAPKKILLPGD